MKRKQIILGDGVGFIISHIDYNKVNKAIEFVKRCTSGEIPFCYDLVRKIPLYSGIPVRKRIKELQEERMNTECGRTRAARIIQILKELREQEKEHYHFDEITYKRLLSNYNKLKSNLKVLVKAGDIDSFTLRSDGRLQIVWWTLRVSKEIDIIEQGWTYSYSEIHYNRRVEMIKRMWSVYNTMPLFDTHGFIPKEYTDQTCMNSTGFKQTHNDISQKVTKGSGEWSSWTIGDRDKIKNDFQMQQNALYNTNVVKK